MTDRIYENGMTETTEEPALIIAKSIDVGGPIDAYVDYFFNLAAVDRYRFSSLCECPVHATEMVDNISAISDKLWKRLDEENESTFYIAIYRDNENDPLWIITEGINNITEIKDTYYRVCEIYRVSGDCYEPDLDIVKLPTRTEIEECYSPATDKTFVMVSYYIDNTLESEEVVGWYYGRPDKTVTMSYVNNHSVKATY